MKFRKRILLLGCMVMLTGCAVKNVAQDITTPVESPGYTRAQMMMMILSQKQEITKAYTDEIWQKKVTDDGKTYEEVFLDDMRNFFKELKVLNLIAAERGIRLTTEEEAMMGEASNQYYNELKKQKTAFSDISHEEVDEMFKEYALAQKVNETIADSDTDEISEEEARVLKLQRIVVGDKNKAQELEAQVNAEGADFFAIAKQNSESKDIDIEVGHEDLCEAADKAVCALNDGQISSIIEDKGKFYIYKCIVGYDKEETAKKKAKMKEKRREDILDSAYQSFVRTRKIDVSGSEWRRISEQVSGDYDGADFFLNYKGAVNREGA